MRLLIILVVSLLGSACAEEDTLRGGQWGELVKVLDRVGTGIFKTHPESAPALELGALIYAKVVVGGVDIVSSDPSIVEVVSISPRRLSSSGNRDYIGPGCNCISTCEMRTMSSSYPIWYGPSRTRATRSSPIPTVLPNSRRIHSPRWSLTATRDPSHSSGV